MPSKNSALCAVCCSFPLSSCLLVSLRPQSVPHETVCTMFGMNRHYEKELSSIPVAPSYLDIPSSLVRRGRPFLEVLWETFTIVCLWGPQDPHLEQLALTTIRAIAVQLLRELRRGQLHNPERLHLNHLVNHLPGAPLLQKHWPPSSDAMPLVVWCGGGRCAPMDDDTKRTRCDIWNLLVGSISLMERAA